MAAKALGASWLPIILLALSVVLDATSRKLEVSAVSRRLEVGNHNLTTRSRPPVDCDDVGAGAEASRLEDVPQVLPSSLSHPKMDLWMSAFVTEDRPRGNRFPRIQVCLYVLQTYTKLPLDNVYLYLEFDDSYGKYVIREAREKIRRLFGDKLKIFKPKRLIEHDEWKQALHNITRISTSMSHRKHTRVDPKRLVIFTQNDDHAFIDLDTSVVVEGLQRMQQDPARFTTLYYSHWPEILKLSGKLQPPIRRGAYVVSRLTLADSVQIFNLEFIKFLIETVPWANFNEATKRVDGLLVHKTVAALSPNGSYPPINKLEITLQNVYIPLRELFRKFDGYSITGQGIAVPKPLLLPPEANQFAYDKASLQAKMLAVPAQGGPTAWNSANNFLIPEDWVRAMFKLYGYNDTTLPGPMYSGTDTGSCKRHHGSERRTRRKKKSERRRSRNRSRSVLVAPRDEYPGPGGMKLTSDV